MINGNDKSLESWIWDAACSIRGAKDAPKFKDYILPLIFTKRLCDVFDDELNRIAKEESAGFITMKAEGRRKAPTVAVKKIVVEIDPCSDRDRLNVA